MRFNLSPNLFLAVTVTLSYNTGRLTKVKSNRIHISPHQRSEVPGTSQCLNLNVLIFVVTFEVTNFVLTRNSRTGGLSELLRRRVGRCAAVAARFRAPGPGLGPWTWPWTQTRPRILQPTGSQEEQAVHVSGCASSSAPKSSNPTRLRNAAFPSAGQIHHH